LQNDHPSQKIITIFAKVCYVHISNLAEIFIVNLKFIISLSHFYKYKIER